MPSTFADVERHLLALNDDFSLGTTRNTPPSDAEIVAIEKQVRVSLAPMRDLLGKFGALILQVKESIWPRAAGSDPAGTGGSPEVDSRPLWQRNYGFVVFGVGARLPEFVSLSHQARSFSGPRALLPVMRVFGSPARICLDAEGRCWEWHPGDTGRQIAGSFYDVVIQQIERLRADRERIGGASASVPKAVVEAKTKATPKKTAAKATTATATAKVKSVAKPVSKAKPAAKVKPTPKSAGKPSVSPKLKAKTKSR